MIIPRLGFGESVDGIRAGDMQGTKSKKIMTACSQRLGIEIGILWRGTDHGGQTHRVF